MGNGVYYINHFDEKKYMRKYGASKKSFKIFTICVAIILLGIILYLIKCFIDLEFGNALSHASIFFISVFWGLIFYFSIWYAGPKPFNYRIETMIVIYNNGLEFVYQHNDDCRRASSRHIKNFHNARIVYRIAYNNIKNIEYDERYHMLYITGHAENIEYKDYEKKLLKDEWIVFGNNHFDENTRYPIILALGNNCEKAFVENLKQRVGMFY